MAAVSPSSSPRLPSPPPIAEDQIGPTSPGISLFEDNNKLPGLHSLDAAASRRIRPGTKAEDMAEGPPLVELQEIDSAFQLTEHLKALHYAHTHPADSNELQPITQDLARQLAQPPANTSKEIWLYELGRFLIQKTNAIIVALFADSPACSPQTCPEMRAGEWQYLCAVHDPPKSCSAIDYCCHTLDWAATSLTSSKMFPSRLGLGLGSGNEKFMQQQMKEITNIFRRVYRIYAHAWFQHRDMFWKVERLTGLYIFFKTVCDEYNLIQPENYTIPSEAEGLEPAESSEKEEDQIDRPRPTSILPRPGEHGQEKALQQEPAGSQVQSQGNTTRRHTREPSNMSVTNPIQEEAEEEDENALPKRTLDRSVTVLHDPEEKQKDEESEEAVDEDTSLPVVTRSNTIKAEDQVDSTEEGETTVIHTEEESQAEVEPKEEQSDVQVSVKALDDPEESAAGDAEEAGKSVAD
ncbi:hypothetical protein M409DRAFT_50329 [Zasmidium cellare ATCC 36951]|uniref:Mob1/phocein n=1 Tax=Zasmidium cellare ATCC 36951 TaxID=1080233 RepID=A0A6A6CZN0_ZASCE|nr:uncharacterized protein M409DRAFT_50329 [Zasmidium cellare ATCC 36951]KAF2171660.1 hypothetical protein M409DRAFT_50329 [Zasmidium cellare ATCC 36951]